LLQIGLFAQVRPVSEFIDRGLPAGPIDRFNRKKDSEYTSLRASPQTVSVIELLLDKIAPSGEVLVFFPCLDQSPSVDPIGHKK
jgi:hypothetical protein